MIYLSRLYYVNEVDSTTRPFGTAILDGVDLDIEGGGSTGYVAFVTQLRTHMDAADKTYVFIMSKYTFEAHQHVVIMSRELPNAPSRE